jgi:hypothetical protein
MTETPLRLREPETLAEKCFTELVYLIPIERCADHTAEKAVSLIQKYIDEATSKERGVKTHNLKSWTEAFEAVIGGGKRHEFRLNDRDFANGDELVLQEYDPAEGSYLGRSLRVKVTHIDLGPSWEIPKDYCVMSISEPYDKRDDRQEG